MQEREALGRLGEIWTRVSLEDRGFRLVARNVRMGRDEIDLIMRAGSQWVFVEVKTRRKAPFGRLQDVVKRPQRAALKRAIRRYLQGHGRRAAWRCVLARVTLPEIGRIPEIYYTTILRE